MPAYALVASAAFAVTVVVGFGVSVLKFKASDPNLSRTNSVPRHAYILQVGAVPVPLAEPIPRSVWSKPENPVGIAYGGMSSKFSVEGGQFRTSEIVPGNSEAGLGARICRKW